MNVGDTVKLVPAYSYGKSENFAEELGRPKTAVVVQVNEKRGWYRVEFEIAPGVKGHECFRL